MATDRTFASAVAVAAVLFGGTWTVFQTQFAYIDRSILAAATVMRERDKALDERTLRLERETKDLRDWADEQFDRRRTLVVQQVEFAQFGARMDDRLRTIEARILLLEQTRPTTSELSGLLKGTNDQLTAFLARIDRLERMERMPPQLPAR